MPAITRNALAYAMNLNNNYRRMSMGGGGHLG